MWKVPNKFPATEFFLNGEIVESLPSKALDGFARVAETIVGRHDIPPHSTDPDSFPKYESINREILRVLFDTIQEN